MKVLIVKPQLPPEIADIPDDLLFMQRIVGGNIQAITPFDDGVVLVCDEESLLKDAEWNRMIYEGCAIKGTFFLCGSKGEHFVGLNDEQLKKYMERFAAPEIFIRTISGLCSIRLL